jgi:hypothetical protein
MGAKQSSVHGNAAGFARASLKRWATNVQAFMILLKAGLPTEAYGVARMGSELAINLMWVAAGGPSERFSDPDSRAHALILEARNATRVWFDEMRRAGAALPKYEAEPWGKALASAAPVKDLPRFRARAECTPATKELYTFAYRGESSSVHSNAVLLASHAAGEPPISTNLIVHNVLVASTLIFGAAADLLADEGYRSIAARLHAAHRSGPDA